MPTFAPLAVEVPLLYLLIPLIPASGNSDKLLRSSLIPGIFSSPGRGKLMDGWLCTFRVLVFEIIPIAHPLDCREILSTSTLLCLALLCMLTLFSKIADLLTGGTWASHPKRSPPARCWFSLLSSHLKTPGGGLAWLVSCVHPASASCDRWTGSHSPGMTTGVHSWVSGLFLEKGGLWAGNLPQSLSLTVALQPWLIGLTVDIWHKLSQ